MSRKHTLLGLAVGTTLALGMGAAQAVPTLQLYEEGGTYCNTTCPGGYSQSWAIDGTTGLRLWVEANSPLYNVHFVASWNAVAGNNPQLFLYGTTLGTAPVVGGIAYNAASAYAGITDSSKPGNVLTGTMHGDISPLQPPANGVEGIFGAGRQWEVFNIGDMTLDETKGVDTSLLSGTGLGSASLVSANDSGQSHGGFELNAYDIIFGPTSNPTLYGSLDGQVVNFDVWGCSNPDCADVVTGYDKKGNPIVSKNSYVNMPYSHDAQWRDPPPTTPTSLDVPEPASMLLLAGGLVAMAASRRRRG